MESVEEVTDDIQKLGAFHVVEGRGIIYLLAPNRIEFDDSKIYGAARYEVDLCEQP